MRKPDFGATMIAKGLSLAMILTSGIIPAQAGHLKNNAAPLTAPGAIGIIESKGAILINGHATNGSFTLWGDELIQATNGARIVFGALGEVKINPGASLQLKMENAKLHEVAGTQAFSASLLAGEMNVKLNQDTSGLVNSASSEFIATKGSNFKVELEAGRAMVQTGMGTILANTYSGPNKTFENKSATSTTTQKDAQYLSTKKLEKLIGSFQIKVPAVVIAEAVRREKAMDELTAKRASFMRSLSITSSSVFYGAGATKSDRSFERSIGAAESLRGVLINGKIIAGREMLWGGETIEAPQGSGARLSVSSIGQVLLNSGAKAQITTETVGVHAVDHSAQKVLAAQILKGDAIIKFDPNSSGYVRAGDSVMAGSRGSQFRVEIRNGNGAVDVTEGSVMVIGNWPVVAPAVIKDSTTGKAKFDAAKYLLRPVSLNSVFQVAVKNSHNIQMRVTDSENKPLADVPVKFTLNGAGSLGSNIFGLNTIEVRTDAHGIASVPYNAGLQPGTSTVTAEVPGTTTTTVTTANVTTQAPDFFSWQGPFPAVVVVAAMIGIGAGVVLSKKDRLPIKGTGDAVIIP